MATLYGISKCDTIKKARTWLAEHGIPYDFHDYKVAGIGRVPIGEWVRRLGWEKLLNRGGTTFRKLPEEARTDLDAPRAIALMRNHPSAIRRPVLVDGETLLVGFDVAAYADALLR